MDVLSTILNKKIVAVIRNASINDIISIAAALKEGGISIIEIAIEDSNSYRMIENVSNHFGNDIIVGAGTVLDPQAAHNAIASGAEFIFSPIVDEETIKITKKYGKVSIPGGMTPTEIVKAYEHGADLVKVFPASNMGPSYLKDIHGPLPYAKLMPTGGINLDNIEEYFKKGAVAVGIGSSLVNTKKELIKSELEYITELSSKFAEKINTLANNK